MKALLKLPFIALTAIIFNNRNFCYSNTSAENLRGNGMGFVENRGQVIDMNSRLRPDILYVGDGGGAKIYLRKGAVSYVFSKEEEKEHPANPMSSVLEKMQQKNTVKTHRIDMEFIGSSHEANTVPVNKTEGYFNYYLGHCPGGITGVAAYNKIVVSELYPNIDVIYYGNKENGLKYDFVIKPGGNPNNIKIKYSGVDNVEIKGNELRIKNSIGEMIERMPKVYQNIDGKIVDVKANYKLNGTTLAFELSNFQINYPLIIDPWVTYYGGKEEDDATEITADNSGNVIVTGLTKSGNFPQLGAWQGSLAGAPGVDNDCFVIKMDTDGNLIWATYFGGTKYDGGYGVDTDSENNIFVTGYTWSNNFPVSIGTPPSLGDVNAFVLKLNSVNGTRLLAKCWGGPGPQGYDYGTGVVVDSGNNVIITGYTLSSNFPVNLPGVPFQSVSGGGWDTFIFKMDASGSGLWATYYGGSGTDFASKIAVDSGDNIVVTGYTESTDFPCSPGAFQTKMGGGERDGFVVKMDVAGMRLWGTYLGGNNVDHCRDIAVNGLNEIVVTGYTKSTDFPFSIGALQTFLGGGDDGFLTKYSAAGAIIWSTYQGGTTYEWNNSCAVDPQNNIYILSEWEDDGGGSTYLYSCGWQKTYGGGTEDQVIVKYDNSGQIICTSHFGGPGYETSDDFNYGTGSITYNAGFIYITACTNGQFPVSPLGTAYQTQYGGGKTDLVIAKLCGKACGDPVLTPSFLSSKSTICAGFPVNFTNTSITPSCDNSGISYLWTFSNGTPANSTLKNPNGITYTNPGIHSIKLVLSNSCEKDSLVKTIAVDPPPTITITGANSICIGDVTTLTASGGNTYIWSTGTAAAVISVNPTSTTSYTVTATGTSGCTATQTVTVNTQIPLANAENDTTICEGAIALLSASGGLNYLWNTGQTTSAINVSPLINTTYMVVVSNGPCIKDAVVSVTVLPAPIAAAEKNSTIISGNSTTLSASGGGTYLWSPSAGLSCVTCQYPVASPQQTTTYYLAVTDASGCTSMDSVIVTVEIKCNNLFVPNAFSPNGDGENDIFYIEGTCIKRFLLQIYDRWGEKVFQTDNINKGWDGFFHGKQMDPGVFFLSVDVALTDETVFTGTKNLSLIR